jgi:Ca-activated chloride channel family protein
VLGFGMGNLKDSKLEQIADHGNGNYAYIDDLQEARKTLVTELGGTLLTVAKDVKIQVEFNPARVRAYRLIGYENRLLDNEDFDDDRKDAGEIGAGHAVTALYEVVPVGAKSDVAIQDPALRYQEPRSGTPAGGAELMFVKVRYKEPNGARSKLLQQAVRNGSVRTETELRFASAVAAFGMLLRESEHGGSSTYDMVLDLARGARGEDESGYRAEFIELVERAAELAAAKTTARAP